MVRLCFQRMNLFGIRPTRLVEAIECDDNPWNAKLKYRVDNLLKKLQFPLRVLRVWSERQHFRDKSFSLYC